MRTNRRARHEAIGASIDHFRALVRKALANGNERAVTKYNARIRQLRIDLRREEMRLKGIES
jgi:hypothetical protein